jgi:hypothetical protein
MTGATVLSLAGVVACSQGPSQSGRGSGADPHTGNIELKIASVPNNVSCIEIDTSDYASPQKLVDATPGQPIIVAISPIQPGWVYLTGRAYSLSCETFRGISPPSYPDDGSTAFSDDAGPSNPETWVAEGTSVFVASGQTTVADLRFHQLGGLDVSVEWCDDGDGGTCDDAGEDAGEDADAGQEPPPDGGVFPPLPNAG